MESVQTWLCKDLPEEAALPTWADFAGQMNGERFETWFREKCNEAKLRWPAKTVRWHMDNASFHKRHNTGVPDLATATQPELVSWIVNNSADSDAIFSFDDFVDDATGDLTPLADLQTMVREHAAADPIKLRAIAKLAGGDIDWTAPYHPQTQPWELAFNNMKYDYRSWPTHQKIADVGGCMRRFAMEIDEDAVRGWVNHTDKYCRAVANRDPDVLDALLLEYM